MPTVEQRAAQPYVAVRGHVTMQTVGHVAARVSEVFDWLGERGIDAAGAPFLRYEVIDMVGVLAIAAGVPVAQPVTGDGEVVAGELPAGRYVVALHTGHPDTLEAATRDLLDWAAAQGLAFDVAPGPDGEQWGARLETYLSDPAEEPDLSQWRTELAFRLAE
ncbi:GyrI-like domain-containing protein [Spirilliplanes yamanashiensis]|uniref:DNA gyrase inhibitor n=1 Tax=Spirilliplanes yamanashiensis TaxID=42233 RepID=A0A8J3YBZ7_9ACTN|nr:GyrI-like domain-containing protein [Spirilliplanes yamanashiensis]MDP9818638.1 effector-binding domain-containing protein [Spirilliplanes yamanashiensis]GIJ05094.1 DNA gyrase inhibitor [Spirilliplanes yamanashiensis]